MAEKRRWSAFVVLSLLPFGLRAADLPSHRHPTEQTAGPQQPAPDEAKSKQLSDMFTEMFREAGIPMTDQARLRFMAELRGGRVTEAVLQAQREYLKVAREVKALQAELERNPSPQLERRLAEARAREMLIMGSAKSPLHTTIMEAMHRHLRDANGGLKPDELRQHLRELERDNPSDPSVHRMLARSLMKEGKFAEAIQEFSRALKFDPNDRAALQGRAIASQRMGDYASARKDAMALLQQDPNDAAALAMMKLTEGRDSPSEGPEAVRVRPPSADPAPAAAGAAAEPAALSAMPAKVINLDPMRAQSDRLAKQAAHDLDMKDWQKAAADAAKAVAADPANGQAYYYQTVAYIQLQQYDLAIQSADQGLEMSPDDRILLDAKSSALNRAGRYGEARLAINKALARSNHKDAQAWFNLAHAHAGLGSPRGEIVDALAQASRLDPAFRPALDAARLAPSDSDLKYLFNAGMSGLAAARETGSPSVAGSPRRFWLIVLATVIGGILMALGFLHVLAPEVSRRLYGPSGAPIKIATALVAGGEKSHEDLVVPGTYQVIRKIGSGGMGTVYEALDLSLRRRVAIKVMRAEIRDDPRERRRFIEEARSVAGLRHPGIVQIHSIEEKPDLFLVFEYVEGKTLDRLLAEKGRLEFSEARRILGGVCEALQYAHSSNIVHRDLKPSNVMVLASGAIKVMDFGVARQVKDAMSRLMTNTVCGTPSYMAPEIEQGVVSGEADVYSLGICLYELLTGDLPFGGTGAGLLLNKMNMNFRAVSSRVKNLPRGIDEVLAKALQAEASKRYKSPGEFKAALDALAG